MKPSMFRSNPRSSPQVPAPKAPAPTITSTRGNPLRGGPSRRSFKEGGATKDSGVTKKMPTAKQMGSLGLKSGGIKKMAGGGLAAGHKSADGIAKKGKTKGKEVAMKKGGYMKGGKC